MAFLFAETGIISRFLLHHVRGHYPHASANSHNDSKACCE